MLRVSARAGRCDTTFDCDFYSYCKGDELKSEYPVSWLPGFGNKRLFKIAEEVIYDLRDVPSELLNAQQLRVKTHTLTNTLFFEAEAAAVTLAAYPLPLQFLDFETIWTGTKPNIQIPFQFSLHRVDEDRILSHDEFLDLSNSDPSEEFVMSLLRLCGDDPVPIFVYSPFEYSCIKRLAERFPTHRDALLAINKRIVDLLPMVRSHYYHPSQHGSWSIKFVLPAIAPDLKHGDLKGVKDGRMAMAAYREAILALTGSERKGTLRDQLLTYCKLDSYAMVRVWQVLSGQANLTLPNHDA
jgi:predicted RecB family nuclease